MPEPPAGLSPASRARIYKVQTAAGHAAAVHVALPSADASVGQARAAVTEPPQETQAHAQQDLVVALGERPKPSPEIEQLCADIYRIIRSKRPPDEESLVKADPAAMAQAAGGQLNSRVQGDTQRVAGSYDQMNQPPQGSPQQQGQPLQAPPESAASPPINAEQATPDPVPAEDVSLDADAKDSQNEIDQAGMNSDAAKLVQTGPVADAHKAQGELEQTAKEDPAKVLAEQKESLAKASSDMAALQQSALDALANSRRSTVSGTTGQQKHMVGSEEQMRTTVSAQAQSIFTTAQGKVNSLLQPLPQTAMSKWDKGVAVASEEFKQHLKKVEGWIEERHGGGWGAVVGAWDWLTGLPGWVTDEYDQAEQKFGDDICNLVREISTEVNGVIMACEVIIQDARTHIHQLFTSLPANLQSWAAGEESRLGAQLDALHDHAIQTRDNFNKDLVNKASQSVQDVRQQIYALRQVAGGLLGQIKDAIGRFLKDPAKFILEGLLQLLGIPPAAFWAVVEKIKHVVKDIADDPLKFAHNLLKALGQGFSQFFDHILDHLLKGFISWLTGSLAQAGVALPKDASLKSIITFILQLMGITWPRIRKLLVKHIGEKNVALIEKAYSIVANLVALGPEGIFEMIKEKLNPTEILKQIVHAAVDYLVKALIKAVATRIILLFNPVGAILQALEAIYKVLKWIFVNAARIFHLVETVVNGIADIIAGSIGGMANAVENALAGLIPPVIDFLADYLGFGDLPDKIKDTIISFQNWIEGILDKVIGWLVEKGKALLSAVGLGGDKDKDKDKDSGEVGETKTFTAGGETHKLWVAVQGDNAVLMLASGPAALLDFLNSDRVTKAVSTDDKRSGDKKIGPKVEKAKGLAEEADIDAEKVLASMQAQKSEPTDGAGQEAEGNEKVKTTEDQLAELLTDILEVISKDGLTIFDVIGKAVDELADTPPPDGYAYAEVHGYREVRRAPGKGAEGEGQYPQVHIDEAGTIQTGSGMLRYDYVLITKYNAALQKADLDGDEAPGDPQSLVNKLTAAGKPEFLEGIRSQMEEIVNEIGSGTAVTGVEVQLGARRQIDYTVDIQTGAGVESALVEYKHWTGKLTYRRRAMLAQRLQTQLRAYVDLARTGGNDYRRLIIVWPSFSSLDASSRGEFNDVFDDLKKHNDEKAPAERVTIEIRT